MGKRVVCAGVLFAACGSPSSNTTDVEHATTGDPAQTTRTVEIVAPEMEQTPDPTLSPGTGSLAGVTYDQHDVRLSGVKVTASSGALDQPRTTVVGEGGQWTIKDLPPGTYAVDFFSSPSTMRVLNAVVSEGIQTAFWITIVSDDAYDSSEGEQDGIDIENLCAPIIRAQEYQRCARFSWARDMRSCVEFISSAGMAISLAASNEEDQEVTQAAHRNFVNWATCMSKSDDCAELDECTDDYNAID